MVLKAYLVKIESRAAKVGVDGLPNVSHDLSERTVIDFVFLQIDEGFDVVMGSAPLPEGDLEMIARKLFRHLNGFIHSGKLRRIKSLTRQVTLFHLIGPTPYLTVVNDFPFNICLLMTWAIKAKYCP
jgi:hypothetical protein